MNTWKILNGTAMYTGGSIYMAMGKFSNGKFFIADNWYISIYDADVREGDQDYDFVGVNYKWCEKHLVEISKQEQKIVTKKVLHFCRLLVNGKADETGWEEFHGYGSDLIQLMEDTGFNEE